MSAAPAGRLPEPPVARRERRPREIARVLGRKRQLRAGRAEVLTIANRRRGCCQYATAGTLTTSTNLTSGPSCGPRARLGVDGRRTVTSASPRDGSAYADSVSIRCAHRADTASHNGNAQRDGLPVIASGCSGFRHPLLVPRPSLFDRVVGHEGGSDLVAAQELANAVAAGDAVG